MPAPAGGAAAFFWHPVAANPINTIQLNPKVILNAFFVTPLPLWPNASD
jgi:hypothetical protein